MKLLIAGLGSIGQRHAHNLRLLLGHRAEIMALRSPERLSALSEHEPEDGAGKLREVRPYRDLDEALAQKPVAVFVCNPTSLHIPVATAAARSGCHVFVEKPVSHNVEGVEALQAIVRERNLQTLTGFQFRFHPSLNLIRRLLQEEAVGRVIHASAHWGEYLPNWHPKEDYRESYSARAELGGGVILTLCHPIDYLRWMLGEVGAVTAMATSDGGLQIDVEDTANILLEFQSGATATVHLNYIQQPPSHRLEIVGTRGTIAWDNETGDVRLYREGVGDWKRLPAPAGFERNSMFLSELRHFLDCISGNAKSLVPLEDGVRTLAVTLAAKVSAAERRRVEL